MTSLVGAGEVVGDVSMASVTAADGLAVGGDMAGSLVPDMDPNVDGRQSPSHSTNSLPQLDDPSVLAMIAAPVFSNTS